MAQKRSDNIWVFNAGNNFSGNPKWLFLHILKNRPEITPYWLCYDKKLVRYMKSRGYKAALYDSRDGKIIASQAGVYVVNQMKEVFQDELQDIKILNLWHGVGCKSIERKLVSGILDEKVSKKYIRNNSIYTNNQLFLVTSPLMEKHFKEQCGLVDEKVIRGGYPCCISNDTVVTFNHDILKTKGLSLETKVIVYSPTFRENSTVDFFAKAIPDMNRLVNILEKKNLLLIFKMHPLMEKDWNYNEMKKMYHNQSHMLFWDNQDDIYEIFPQVDAAIIDYSSIFYDMLACGVKKFIRYMFDIEDKNNVRDFVFDVKEMTCGYDCHNFEELLYALEHYEDVVTENKTENERIYNLFWSYTKESSNEDIINAILEFKIENKELPILYSFDIFDTLIQRKTLEPRGVFYYMQDKLLHEDFPDIIKKNFVRIRMSSETNVRTWYKKTEKLRDNERLEITLDEIYDRIQDVYAITDTQKEYLKQLEIATEYMIVEPCAEKVAYVKELLAKREKVVLISDMYLPKDVIKEMLRRVDPVLAELPLYLSSDIGVQKTTRKLFLKVYHDLDYNYKQWIHYGDNPNADKKQPEALGIQGVKHEIPKFNNYEQGLVKHLDSYDGYLTGAIIARNRVRNSLDENEKEYFAYSYVALCLVPYINWVLKHAVAKGINTLYFISRDGHHLKRIADAIIEIKHYPIETKYIYGSRKAWRIPSFITEVDKEFFSEFGNISSVKSYADLLKAMDIGEELFLSFFPEFENLKENDKAVEEKQHQIRERAKQSKEYGEYLLKRASEKRLSVVKYLQQEINFAEKFAFVEYWGRGYTQECLTRLLHEASGQRLDNPFYYARSIYGTEGYNIRYNFTTNNSSLIFLEAIFANLPYKTVSHYQMENGRMVPVIEDNKNDMELHRALEENLVRFAKELYSQPIMEEDCLERSLFNFAMDYYRDNQDKKLLVNNLAHLVDSVEQYGKVIEFAPKITLKSIFDRIVKGKYFKTKSRKMSIARSSKIYGKMYAWYKDELKKSLYFSILQKVKRKFVKILSKE